MTALKEKNLSVVIVGAGITGLSTAFHLADKGVPRILLIDKGQAGSGSSSKSGAVNTMLMPTETGTLARSITMDIFERFSNILPDYSFHQDGCLFIYDEPEFLETQSEREMQQRVGAKFEVLRQKELQQRFPSLTIGDNEVGVLDLRGGWNEPDTYINALQTKVREMGVEIREHEPVENFILESGRVRGVRTRASGELHADTVVCTVNAWANSLLSSVDQLTPARHFVHERFVTSRLNDVPHIPATNDSANQVYYRPTEDQRLLFGTTAQDPLEIKMPDIDFDYAALKLAPNAAPFIQQAIAHRFAQVQGLKFEKHRIGLISLTVDRQPNIGPVRALPGLFLGSNFNSGGFGYHAVAGLLLSEFILDGHTRLDVKAFSPDRFADFDTKAFLAKEMNYQQIVRRH